MARGDAVGEDEPVVGLVVELQGVAGDLGQGREVVLDEAGAELARGEREDRLAVLAFPKAGGRLLVDVLAADEKVQGRAGVYPRRTQRVHFGLALPYDPHLLPARDALRPQEIVEAHDADGVGAGQRTGLSSSL